LITKITSCPQGGVIDFDYEWSSKTSGKDNLLIEYRDNEKNLQLPSYWAGNITYTDSRAQLNPE
jgi:hypothetical protein